MTQRQQSSEEWVWKVWTDFTDKAEVAPDTRHDAEWLARRFNELNHAMTTPDYVRSIMPENQGKS